MYKPGPQNPTTKVNMLIISGSVDPKPGPSRVSDSSVSAEHVVYETFVGRGELGQCFSVLLV